VNDMEYWNKGLTKNDDTRLLKISKIMSKRMKGENHPFYGKKRPLLSKMISGKNHPLYGKHHSKESKEKMSQSQKKRLFENPKLIKRGKLNPMYGKIGERSPNFGKKRSAETKEKIIEFLKERCS